MRFSELQRLKKRDVDLENGRILARGFKGSRRQRESPRYISIHAGLKPILVKQIRDSAGQHAFTYENGKMMGKAYLYSKLRGLLKATEFEGIGFHCFRHSFASNLAAKGVDQRAIDQFMGHQTAAMRKRYQHLIPDEQRAAINQLDF